MRSGNMNLRDIFSTPEQLNSKRGMIMRSTSHTKSIGKNEKTMRNTKVELNPLEKIKETKNDELEVPLASS